MALLSSTLIGSWLEGWEIGIKLPCGRFPHHPPPHGECCVDVEGNAARIVCVAGGGAMAGVALVKGLKVVLPQSASFNT
jgi:hypothetical protein